jgi:hypothetical protein
MSTKSSLFYEHQDKNYIHCYTDIACEDKIFIEKTVNQEFKLAFEPAEICILSRSVDLNELDRQASITDESIKDYAVNRLNNYNNLTNEWSKFSYYLIFDHKDADNIKIEKLEKHYFNLREKIRLLRERVLSSRVSKYVFGLEEIK